jgi:hypothetical protein
MDRVPGGGVLVPPPSPLLLVVLPDPEGQVAKGVEVPPAVLHLVDHVLEVDPHPMASREQDVDERWRVPDAAVPGHPVQEGTHVLEVRRVLRGQLEHPPWGVHLQRDVGRPLGGEHVDARRKLPRQSEVVLPWQAAGFVQSVDHQHDRLALPVLVPGLGGRAQDGREELGPECRGRRERLDEVGVQIPGMDQLGGQVAEPGDDALLTGGSELHEMMDIASFSGQPGQERRLADAGVRLEQVVATVVDVDELVEVVDQPLPADEPVMVQVVVDLPGADVAGGDRLMRPDEDACMVAGGQDAPDDVATDGDGPFDVGHG